MKLLGLMGALGLVASTTACGEESCAPFPSGVQKAAVVETTSVLLTERGPVHVLLIDDGDLYWYDENGAILKLPRGESLPVELRPAQRGFVGDSARASMDSGLTIDGFTSDAEHLYWGESSVYTGVDAGFIVGFSAPGRLLSLDKNGGEEHVLLESPERTLRPVAVETSRIIVLSNGGFYALPSNASQLEPLPSNPPVDGSRVVGNQIYWTEPQQETPRLLRAGFDQAKPEVVARIEGSAFDVGPGYVLWRQERLQTEPELVLVQNFVLLDEAAGCTRALPSLGESISSAALDDAHVYWYSFNALGSVSDSSTPPVTVRGDSEMPLVRASLKTGALERLRTPGLSLPLGSQIVGQDAEQIYVSTSQGLTAVRKP